MRIKHPTIPGMTAEVDNPVSWLAAGWLPDEPQPVEADPVEVVPDAKPRKGTK